MSHQRPSPARYSLWRANAAKSGAITGVMAAAMLAGNRGPLDIAVGIPPFMFMVYVILSSRSSKRARKAEERAELDAAMYLTAQCERLLSRINDIWGSPDGLAAQVAFGHMLSAIRLLRSQYGRYLDERSVLAAQEAERIIIDASLPGKGGAGEDAGARISLLGRQIRAIRGGMLDIDDPRLRAVREAL